MTIKKNIAIACGIYTRDRTKKVTMARALNTGDADNPARRGGEICTRKSSPRRRFSDLKVRPGTAGGQMRAGRLLLVVRASARNVLRHQLYDIGA